MPGGSFFKSTAVRLAVIYSSLFIIFYLGANVVAYQMVLGYLDDRLDAAVMERYREIESIYRLRGLPGAVEMINSHGPAIRGQETIYTLRDALGRKVAGNVDIGQVPTGFSSVASDDSNNYKLYRSSLSENDLVVGVSEGDTYQLARIVLFSFGWTTAVVCAISLAGAAVLRYRARKRIFALSQTAHAVGHGELSKRLEVSPKMDEIDVLCSELNVALGRLEASVGALRQVTTDIAHDLNTPVARAFLALDEALARENSDEVRAAAEAALTQLSTLAETFDALLRIAQIESKSRTANFMGVDIGELAREMLETFEVIAAEENHVIKSQVTLDRCVVRGDAGLLRQMLANLLVNAIRHTPEGSTIVTQVSRHDNAVTIVIADDGPGIPPNERTKVFERFYRLDKSRTTEGSGLGLSMVKAICELHDAQLLLSDASPGARFSISLPMA